MQGSIDWSKIRLDRSKLMQIVFLQNFPTQLNPSLYDVYGLCFASSIKGKNPSHVLKIVDMLCVWISCKI